MTDARQHRSPKPRERRRTTFGDPRCRPTLFARFVRGDLVELEHRHIQRSPISTRTGEHFTDSQRAAQNALPFDEGCRGLCVGRRDVLPLSYFDNVGAHREVPSQQ